MIWHCALNWCIYSLNSIRKRATKSSWNWSFNRNQLSYIIFSFIKHFSIKKLKWFLLFFEIHALASDNESLFMALLHIVVAVLIQKINFNEYLNELIKLVMMEIWTCWTKNNHCFIAIFKCIISSIILWNFFWDNLTWWKWSFFRFF